MVSSAEELDASPSAIEEVPLADERGPTLTAAPPEEFEEAPTETAPDWLACAALPTATEPVDDADDRPPTATSNELADSAGAVAPAPSRTTLLPTVHSPAEPVSFQTR